MSHRSRFVKTVASRRELFKLKIENGKLKIAVGGVPPQSIREDTRIKELHQMPEYGIDAIFSLFIKYRLYVKTYFINVANP